MVRKPIEEFLENWTVIEMKLISEASKTEENVQSFLDVLRIFSEKKIYSEKIIIELDRLRIYYNKTQNSHASIGDSEAENFIERILDLKNKLML